MRKLAILCSVGVLASCGAICVGSNHETNIYNNSDEMITVSADSGIYKIKPEQSMKIYSANEMTITSKNTDCPSPTVPRNLNTGAVVLDVFPGFLLGIIPVFIDAVTNNLYKMPESYSYSCM